MNNLDLGQFYLKYQIGHLSYIYGVSHEYAHYSIVPLELPLHVVHISIRKLPPMSAMHQLTDI